jgi:hypothetical protein
MRLLTTVSFAKETKKVELEAELKLISKEPTIGQKKSRGFTESVCL